MTENKDTVEYRQDAQRAPGGAMPRQAYIKMNPLIDKTIFNDRIKEMALIQTYFNHSEYHLTRNNGDM